MPSEGGSSTPTKASSKSSIRHSLGLASKALAAISKDKDGAKKTKDTASRRLSAVDAKPMAPRASLGDVNRPPSIASSRRSMTGTPDSKTVRRRVSAVKEDQPEGAGKGTEGVTRSASLRPRTGPSALPKYRPRSVVGEKPPSPVRAGVRRRLAGSDDDQDEDAAKVVETAAEKAKRPISPLPQRAALKVATSSTINAPSPPVKLKPKAKDTPPRPTKTVKTASSHAPRPSSSASSSSSFTPRTPKSATKPAAKPHGSPLRGNMDSPLARHSKLTSTHLGTPTEAANMSHISEGNSEDEEEVGGLLLAAPPGAPTPAMPRTVSSRRPRKAPPQTPTRTQLPGRANLSYLSPMPPTSEKGSSSLRPQPVGDGATVGRGSILSWEQLASESSRTLGEDEITSMLSEMAAPFRSGAVSPAPESPVLSAMNSPGEFGSISQVLLPDVTPSPAVHANTSRLTDKDVPPVDAAVVTLLRLQLASAESIAKERLHQMQAMEEEIHQLKQARMRDAEELRQQVGDLEHELRGSLELRQRNDEDRSAHIAALQDQLRAADQSHVQQVDVAIQETRANAQAEAIAVVKREKAKMSAVWSARVAGTQWAFVRDFAEDEREGIKGDLQVLSALLSNLDAMRAQALTAV